MKGNFCKWGLCLVLLPLTHCDHPSNPFGGINTVFHWEFEYNNDGYLSKIADPGGKTIEWTYKFYEVNNQPRIVDKIVMSERTSHYYDELGRLTRMEDGSGYASYQYDDVGRLSQAARGEQPAVSFSYNTLDMIISMELSNGWRIDYEYDFLNRLSRMVTPAGSITYIYRPGDGVVWRTLPNGVQTQYQYLPNGQLASITHVDRDNRVIQSYTYSYNAHGLIDQIREGGQAGEHTVTYEYDQASRLVAFTDRNGSKTEYAYDGLGNRTETKVDGNAIGRWSYDGVGRMLSANGVGSQHDLSGNLLTNKAGEINYEYTGDNQLAQAGDVRYDYDGDGKLIARIEEGQQTSYTNHPLSEIWQPLLATTDKKEQTFYLWEGNNPIGAIGNGLVTFFLTDHLHSVRMVTDGSGRVVRRNNYDAYGVPDGGNSEQFAPGFTGLFYEPHEQLYITKARAYDPSAGRFLQIDPLHQTPSGTQKDLSLFAYCGGDPLNFVDPVGRQARSIDQNAWDRQRYINQMEQVRWKSGSQYALRDLYDIVTTSPQVGSNQNSLTLWGIEEMLLHSGKSLNIPMPRSLQILRTAAKAEEYMNVIKSIAQNTGISMQTFNPPNVSQKHSTGWFGSQQYETTDARLSMSENLYTGGYRPGTGSFVQNRSIALTDPYGAIVKREEYRTPTTSFWERGMLQTFPLGEYYDPEATSLESQTRSSAKYREITQRGSTQYNPVAGHGTAYNNRLNFSDNLRTAGSESRSFARWAADLRVSNMPSNVGGVYLGGAGEAFDGLGALSGIAIDEATGKLVLISEDQGAIDLPPLRLDDVVTVFQSVYQQGKAPYVSIDPDPDDPKGPTMNTRHGEATQNTYVGWVLFETDRIMKAYSLGEDNVTKQPINSGIPGYDQVLNRMFQGGSGSNWERFWIVPDHKEVSADPENHLQLLSIPLKVNTQKMVMRQGKLVPAPGVNSSSGATTFSSWFTQHYDEISDESYSIPPDGSGFNTPVPVFKELERIALITALAEQLRDQGVPYPFWMRQYNVKKFPIPKTTPSHTVTRNRGNATYTIFGGVDLSVDKDRIFVSPPSREQVRLARTMEPAIQSQSFFEPTTLHVDERTFQTAALPTNDAKDLAPNVLEETDMAIPMRQGQFLTLTRLYSSFVEPLDGTFGKSFSFDLPLLEQQKALPLGANGSYGFVYHLISPLNSYYKKIDNLYVGNNTLIGFETSMVIVEDGSKLHFNRDGFLVGHEQQASLTIYKRDQNNRIIQIFGCHGNEFLSNIQLQYDQQQVAMAKGSDGSIVQYRYSEEGRLTQVKYFESATAGQPAIPIDTLAYEYTDHLITGVRLNNKWAQQFRYNDKGQLLGTSTPGYESNQRITSSASGRTVSTELLATIPKQAENKSWWSWFQTGNGRAQDTLRATEYTQYDRALRPIKQVTADGQITEWDYSDPTYNQMALASPDGRYTIKQWKDGSHTSHVFPDGISYDEYYDKSGHLESLYRANTPLYKQEWSGSQLAATEFENARLHYRYHPTGAVQSTILTSPGKSDSWNEWVENRYNAHGVITSSTDYTGMKRQYRYDADGALYAVVGNKATVNIRRNEGLVKEVVTSWGEETTFSYDYEGQLTGIVNDSPKGGSSVKFSNGQVTEISGSDGGIYQITYFPAPRDLLVKSIQAPVNHLEYDYDDLDLLKSVVIDDSYRVGYKYDEAGRVTEISIRGR